MGVASIEPANRALGHLGDAANRLLSRHDTTGTALALVCLEAASDLTDAGVEPAAVATLPADVAMQRAAGLLQLDHRAEFQIIGATLLHALVQGD